MAQTFEYKLLQGFKFIINNCHFMNQQAEGLSIPNFQQSGDEKLGFRTYVQPKPEQNLAKQEQILHQIQETPKCSFFKSRRNKIIAIFLISLLVIASIVTPLVIVFGTVKMQKDVDTFMIDYQNQSVAISSTSVSNGINYINLQMTGKKVEAVQPYSQIITREVKSDDPTKKKYEITVPVFMLIQQVGQNIQEWLDLFNKDPRDFMEKFLKPLKLIDFKNQQEKSQFTLTQVYETNFFDISYDPEKQEFSLLKFQQGKDQGQNQIEPEKKAGNEQNWVLSLFDGAIKKLKQTIATNLNILKNNSDAIKRQQEQFTIEKDIQSEWAQALINQCRTLNYQQFRCSFEGLKKLVPGLQAEDMTKIPDNAIITYALKIKLEQAIA